MLSFHLPQRVHTSAGMSPPRRHPAAVPTSLLLGTTSMSLLLGTTPPIPSPLDTELAGEGLGTGVVGFGAPRVCTKWVGHPAVWSGTSVHPTERSKPSPKEAEPTREPFHQLWLCTH